MTELANRWQDISQVLSNKGAFACDGFEADTEQDKENLEFLLEESKILVIGAGGLGCELLKDLALLGFRNIDVIDMDEIDLSNLNRQFLFRKADIGKSKAEVAAAFINKRVAGAKVVGHYKKIQDFAPEYYEQFNLIVAGLDNIKARRWINAMVVNLVAIDDDGRTDPDTVIPLVDGGTEGFKGQCRVILPTLGACFECALDTFPPPTTFPMCTVRNTPRLPEHCIKYALAVQWPEERADTPLDNDNPEHITWLCKKAQERADKFGISGVDYRLTQGVTKNIIPAIASTNAIISAACANEAFKIATQTAPYLNNWMTYNGLEGLYTYTFNYERRSSCPVSGSDTCPFNADPLMTLEDLIYELTAQPNFQLDSPSITTVTDDKSRSLYMQRPRALEEATRPNLAKPLQDLLTDGSTLNVTDPMLPSVALTIVVRFSKEPGSYVNPDKRDDKP
mmetsp:Transcript_9475/g.10462  ORF Transcript_9475/g.10462 Transcript_9475/m.10462 type:complete len:451 (-) Transcript_9475:78-1430(-)